ncbi:MAG: NAD(P)H-binding protein [Salinimicrobium sp.]
MGVLNKGYKNKVLLAGASGALGLEVLKLLSEKGLEVRAFIKSEDDDEEVSHYTKDIWKADASKKASVLKDITKDISIIVSALGKSVSLFTNRGNSFLEDDFYANRNILNDALNHSVKRFIYVSIKGVEEADDFEIPKSHKMFEDVLRDSDLNYTILRPVGFFSGLNDLLIMAKRKIIPVIGDGQAKTNSIHQKDLAKIILDQLEDGPQLLEVGGPLIHTRLEMAEFIKNRIGGEILKVPEKIAEWGMVIPEIIDENMAERLKFFKYINTHDMIGVRNGNISFNKYLKDIDKKDLP